MLTQNSLKIVSLIFWQATFLRLLPYKWNAQQFLLITIRANSKVHFLQLFASCFWVWGYTAFIWAEYYRNQDAFTKKENRSRAMLQLDFGLAYALISISVLNTVKRRDEVAALINQMFYLIKKLDEKVIPERRKRKLDLCEMALAALILTTYGHSFFGAVFFLEDPTSPRYLYSLVGEQFHSGWILLVFFIIEYCTYVIMWQHMLLISVAVLCYAVSLNSWLREIHCRKGGTETDGLMRQPKYSYSVYRSLKVLNQCFNFCFSSMQFPWFNFFMVAIPAITNTYVIRHHNELSIVFLLSGASLSLIFMVSLLIIYPRAAAIHILSLSYLKSMRRECGATNSKCGPVTKKHMKACFPLKVKYGVFGFIQRITTLKLLGIIFYWTMKSLLLMRKK